MGERAVLSRLLDDLEYHRAFDVEARLERAILIEQDALEAGATDLQMRGRLVEADMDCRPCWPAVTSSCRPSSRAWATLPHASTTRCAPSSSSMMAPRLVPEEAS